MMIDWTPWRERLGGLPQSGPASPPARIRCSTTRWPTSLPANTATVWLNSEIGTQLGRWPFPSFPRDTPEVPQSFLIRATR